MTARCFECVPSMPYGTVEQLEAHIASHHLKMLPYKCVHCEHSHFPTEQSLINHHELIHKQSSFQIVCEYSPKVRSQRKTLAQKVENSMALSGVYVDPQVQPKVEPQVVQPKAEPQVVQPKVEPQMVRPKVEPQVEPKVESVKEELNDSDVGGLNQFVKCTLCSEMISTQYHCKLHHANASHAKLILFECGVCHQAFETLTKANIIRHMKRKHPGQEGTFVDNKAKYKKQLSDMFKKCFPKK